MEQRIVELQQGDLDSRKELDAYYDQALAYIKSHLEAFYLHYAEEDGLSISQVTQILVNGISGNGKKLLMS